MEIERSMPPPISSFFLLGPRGTGKSTYINSAFPKALKFDLLQSKDFLPLSADPSQLQNLTSKLKAKDWVFIDEIQKIPALLDEVHSLMESRKLQFALSGSSARKIRRSEGNLLAGRAISLQLFPMTYSEYHRVHSVDDAIEWGSLPKTIVESKNRSHYLASYVETYLREELIAEGILRKLEPFARFLNVCGIYNAQILNVDNISRESFVGRSTVQTYLEVLEETLIAHRLPPLQKKWNSGEASHPKFYLFDSGVARACSNLGFEEVDSVWRGFSFESLIINEVRAANRYLNKMRSIFYYRFHNGYEIDLIIETKRKTLSNPAEFTAIEIKNANKWDKRWNDPLLDLKQKSKGKIKRLIGIYRGKSLTSEGDVQIYRAEDFLRELGAGKIL